MVKRFFSSILAVLFLCGAGGAFADDSFPLRAKFSTTVPISLEDLGKEYDGVKIVDVRSKFEFNTIHINKAVLVPVSKDSFLEDLAEVRDKTGAEKLVFYCNGHTCAKSYEAAEKAMADGFTNVFVFDAGIFDWTNAQPDKTTLLGTTPTDPAKIIPKSELEAALLSYNDFAAKAASPDALVIDVRDASQREVNPPLAQISNIPLDRLVKTLGDGEYKDKVLLIYDAVGKQVEWLQYYLKEKGYSKFYFLKDGVKGLEKK